MTNTISFALFGGTATTLKSWAPKLRGLVNRLVVAEEGVAGVRVSLALGEVPIGAFFLSFYVTPPTNYLPVAGGTIGNSVSGGTLLASPDAQAIFAYLWDNLSDGDAPVSSGRGKSALDDFAEGKTITMPDWSGILAADFIMRYK